MASSYTQLPSPKLPSLKSSTSPSTTTTTSAATLSKLRALAQAHLDEIATEQAQEEQDEARKEAELQRYVWRPRNSTRMRGRMRKWGGKIEHAETETEHEDVVAEESDVSDESRKTKLRAAQDVIARIFWDTARFNPKDFVVGYVERFEGLMEMPLLTWVAGREVTEEEFVPGHRVRYVKRVKRGDVEGEVVWSRDEKIDLVFGSGLGNTGGQSTAGNL